MKENKNIQKNREESVRNHKIEMDDHDLDGNISASFIKQNGDNSEENVTTTYNFKWMLALLFTGIIGSFVFSYIRNHTPSNHLIYAEHFEIFPDVITSLPASSKDKNKHSLTEAMSFYNEGDYNNAISKFNDFKGNNKIQANAMFYKAISLMANNKIADANTILQGLVTIQNSSSLNDATLWYLALSHFRLGEYQQAKKTFENFPADHYKYKESREILAQIN